MMMETIRSAQLRTIQSSHNDLRSDRTIALHRRQRLQMTCTMRKQTICMGQRLTANKSDEAPERHKWRRKRCD